MLVSQVMSRDVRVAHPIQSIRDVAEIMAEIDAGFMPVGEDDQLVGVITDRDITVRAVAAGKGPYTAVRDVMTRDVRYCFEDEDLDHVARNMGEQRVRRMPVVDRHKRLVGVLALADVALSDLGAAGHAIAGVSMPGGPHNQRTQRAYAMRDDASGRGRAAAVCPHRS